MEISKSLPRPNNWQDFETLCKNLWGEIWNCPEIKKNGRAGQNQSGVDVYGIKEGEKEYYGIQCKGKDIYTNKQFTKAEIDKELQQALNFKPKLKKFYFTTTAVKDTVIEEYIRCKNIEFIEKGLFEVHIFSWEDIVELIYENQQTYNKYVKNLNFKTNKSVAVEFRNSGSTTKILPKFKHVYITKSQKAILADVRYDSPLDAIFQIQRKFDAIKPISIYPDFSKTKTNQSYCEIELMIKNTGSDPIEEYQIYFEICEEISDINKSNVEQSKLSIIPLVSRTTSNLQINKDKKSFKVIPVSKILVGDDILYPELFFIKPLPKDYTINIKWKLISKDLKAEGILSIEVCHQIEYDRINKLVEDPREVGIEKLEYQDYIEEKDEN